MSIKAVGKREIREKLLTLQVGKLRQAYCPQKLARNLHDIYPMRDATCGRPAHTDRESPAAPRGKARKKLQTIYRDIKKQ
ncbi:MAG: hypothetical protein K2L83_00600 [Muribaculaceae bacterium]|nr:hypothetical protein [Muribaculaceae bacterium]